MHLDDKTTKASMCKLQAVDPGSLSLTHTHMPRAYLHRCKIIEDLTCPCERHSQTTYHLIRECTLLSMQRQILKNSITKTGRRWPISNTELANKYTNLFQKFVNSILKPYSRKYTTMPKDSGSRAIIHKEQRIQNPTMFDNSIFM
jgi:hypothetical protein